MKLSELVADPKGHYIGDVIGASKLGKELAAKQTPAEKLALKKLAKTRAVGIAEGIGELYTQFQGWLAGKNPSEEELKKFLAAMAVEAESRGETVTSMIDDLMSPLEANELEHVFHMKNVMLSAAAKLELSHRDKGGTWDTPR
jgi:hypothetical protein